MTVSLIRRVKITNARYAEIEALVQHRFDEFLSEVQDEMQQLSFFDQAFTEAIDDEERTDAIGEQIDELTVNVILTTLDINDENDTHEMQEGMR